MLLYQSQPLPALVGSASFLIQWGVPWYAVNGLMDVTARFADAVGKSHLIVLHRFKFAELCNRRQECFHNPLPKSKRNACDSLPEGK